MYCHYLWLGITYSSLCACQTCLFFIAVPVISGENGKILKWVSAAPPSKMLTIKQPSSIEGKVAAAPPGKIVKILKMDQQSYIGGKVAAASPAKIVKIEQPSYIEGKVTVAPTPKILTIEQPSSTGGKVAAAPPPTMLRIDQGSSTGAKVSAPPPKLLQIKQATSILGKVSAAPPPKRLQIDQPTSIGRTVSAPPPPKKLKIEEPTCIAGKVSQKKLQKVNDKELKGMANIVQYYCNCCWFPGNYSTCCENERFVFQLMSFLLKGKKLGMKVAVKSVYKKQQWPMNVSAKDICLLHLYCNSLLSAAIYSTWCQMKAFLLQLR